MSQQDNQKKRNIAARANSNTVPIPKEETVEAVEEKVEELDAETEKVEAEESTASKEYANSENFKKRASRDPKRPQGEYYRPVKSEIEEEEPEKRTMAQKFFDSMDTFGDLFILNIAFVLACIPILTIGDAITSLWATCFKMIKKKQSGAWGIFWNEMKKNFKTSTIVWLILCFIYFLLMICYSYFLDSTGLQANLLLMLMAAVLVYLVIVMPLLFPLMARYETSVGRYFKNSLILFLTHFGTWFFVVLPLFAVVTLYSFRTMFFVKILMLFVLILIAMMTYGVSFKVLQLFDDLEEAEAKKAEEN